MRQSWLREPIRYFLLYAVAGVAVIPCSIVFALLKSHGYGPLILSLPFVVGIIGGLAVIAWFDNSPNEAQRLQVPQQMVPNVRRGDIRL
jgi:hypothetical protein